MRNRNELHKGPTVEKELHEGKVATAPHDEKRAFGSNLLGPLFKFRQVQRRLAQVMSNDEDVVGNRTFPVRFFRSDSDVLRQVLVKLFSAILTVYGDPEKSYGSAFPVFQADNWNTQQFEFLPRLAPLRFDEAV